MPQIDQKLERIQTLFDASLAKIETNTARLSTLEQRHSDVEDQCQAFQNTIASQSQTIQLLSDKLDDLENRHRRNNLRFVGIPESFRGDQLLNFLAKDLMVALGINGDGTIPQIERAHRLGPEQQREGQRPRPVIAKYLDFRSKEMILAAYRKIPRLLVLGSQILIFQDFSVLVSKKRKEFSEVCRTLHAQNKRFALLYPAKLRVIHNGQPHYFATPEEAKVFLQLHPPSPARMHPDQNP